MPIVVPGTGPLASTTGGAAGITQQGVATQLATRPGIYPVATTETAYPYSIDVSNYLSGTDYVLNPVATLILTSTGAILTGWQNSITVVGTIINVNINISKLQIGQTYQILVHFTASAIKAPTYTSIIQVIA